MSKDGQKTEVTAWQPFTFRGTAAFAKAGWPRLLLAQALAAAIVSTSCVWFLWRNYAPVITEAVQKMPPGAVLEDGRLQGIPDPQIAENRFLALAVTSEKTVDFGQSADVQAEFRANGVRLSSILRSFWGSMELGYGPGWHLDLGPATIQPWWGAWRPILLGCAGVAIVILLLCLWALLAALYTAPAKLVAWLADRELSWGGAWRLSGAALIPGAAVLALDVLLYGCRVVDIIGFGVIVAAHFAIGWIYSIISPGFAPRLFPSIKQNPFSAPST